MWRRKWRKRRILVSNHTILFVISYNNFVFIETNSDFSSDSSTDEDVKKKKSDKKTKKEEIEPSRYFSGRRP